MNYFLFYIILVFAAFLDFAMGSLGVSAVYHIIPQLLAVLAGSAADARRSRTMITPLTVMFAAYSVIVIMPIATNSLSWDPMSADEVAAGSWCFLVLLISFEHHLLDSKFLWRG